MLSESDLTAEREAAILAPYAMHSAASAGRKYPEPPHPYRGPFQRDRDRILHSAAFRRLSQKTQVFTGEMGDYHRTRLTHTLEVASIARTLARALRLNEDLVEALALAHDIGHPPFGHSGEEVLDECLRDTGGFNHNAQALRIVELLETRYPEFPGLNLSREVLEGQGQRVDKQAAGRAGQSPLLEVQVVDAADSIAYDSHDADDALAIGLVDLGQLLTVPLWREAADRVRRRYANLDDRQLCRAIVHELINWQVDDLLSGASTGVGRVAGGHSGGRSPVAGRRGSVDRVGRKEARIGELSVERGLPPFDRCCPAGRGPTGAPRNVRSLSRRRRNDCRRSSGGGRRRTVCRGQLPTIWPA